MLLLTKEQKTYYVLRVASAMCFIGHGAFGIITKPIWCNYFAVFGIGHDLAYQLMPVLGMADILMGIIMLVYPIRAIALWLVVWGLITATLRPLSGEPFAELLERAGNFGAPLAMLLLCGTGEGLSSWFLKISMPDRDSSDRLKMAGVCLRCTGFLLLAGHSWLNLADKMGLITQYTSLGFHDAHLIARTTGIFEIGMALSVLMRPSRHLLLILLVWKITTELFYPHYEVFEWIERGGSYGVLLGLWFVMNSKISAVRRGEPKPDNQPAF
jgi:hypothetical protein